MSATLGHIRRDADMAGQISYTVTVDYGHDEPPETASGNGHVCRECLRRSGRHDASRVRSSIRFRT